VAHASQLRSPATSPDLRAAFGFHAVPFTREIANEHYLRLPFLNEALAGLQFAVEARMSRRWSRRPAPARPRCFGACAMRSRGALPRPLRQGHWPVCIDVECVVRRECAVGAPHAGLDALVRAV
jgi:hypothetical protein